MWQAPEGAILRAMSRLTFIVADTPAESKLVTSSTQLTLEEVAQLLELNGHDLFTQAYLAERVTHCGFTLRVLREPQEPGDNC